MWFWLKPYLWVTGNIDAILLWFKPKSVRGAELGQAWIDVLQPAFRPDGGMVACSESGDRFIFSHRGYDVAYLPTSDFSISKYGAAITDIRREMKRRNELRHALSPLRRAYVQKALACDEDELGTVNAAYEEAKRELVGAA